MWSDSDLSPVQRRQRDAAVGQVEKAWASGQISMFERDLILHGLAGIATRGELAQQRADLETLIAKNKAKSEALDAESASERDERDAEPADTTGGTGSNDAKPESPIVAGVSRRTARTQRFAPVFVASLAALLVLTAAITAVVLVSSVVHMGDKLSGHFGGIGKTHLLAKDGLWTTSRDLQNRFGTTKIVSADVHDSYAVITRRTRAGDITTFHYDGHAFTKSGKPSAADADAPRIDFADVDVPATADLVEETPARVGVRGEAVTHLVVRAAGSPNAHNRRPTRLFIYADNGEDRGHIRANAGGEVLQTYPVAE